MRRRIIILCQKTHNQCVFSFLLCFLSISLFTHVVWRCSDVSSNYCKVHFKNCIEILKHIRSVFFDSNKRFDYGESFSVLEPSSSDFLSSTQWLRCRYDNWRRLWYWDKVLKELQLLQKLIYPRHINKRQKRQNRIRNIRKLISV